MANKTYGYSGSNYDKWVASNYNNSTLGKVQKKFWFTKSAMIHKFGKKRDEYIATSDEQLEAKIELFKAIELSTKELLTILLYYQSRICVLAQEENNFGRMLKDCGKKDSTKAGKMMGAVGKTLSYTAQQRVGLRNPLFRLYQEVETFNTRAIEDTARTVNEVEKVKTEYRGALMWMKSISQDFNPDQYQQLERYRQVQSVVKQKKANYDRIKVKVLQKIELLAASRCNMFSHALILYQDNMITFSDKISKALNTVGGNFKEYEPYKFKVIKELADLSDAEEASNQGSENKGQVSEKENMLSNKKSDSLLNLFTETEDNDDSLIDTSEECIQNGSKMYSDIELLGNSKNNKESDIFKDFFDSNSTFNQELPAFGSELTASNTNENEDKKFNAFNQENSNISNRSENLLSSSQVFMPSQLLDMALLNMQQSYSTAQTCFPETTSNNSQNIKSETIPSVSAQKHADSLMNFTSILDAEISNLMSTCKSDQNPNENKDQVSVKKEIEVAGESWSEFKSSENITSTKQHLNAVSDTNFPQTPSLGLEQNKNKQNQSGNPLTLSEMKVCKEKLEKIPKEKLERNPFLNPKEKGGARQKDKQQTKVDWFKAFEEIDPLSDPASAIFNKSLWDKQC